VRAASERHQHQQQLEREYQQQLREHHQQSTVCYTHNTLLSCAYTKLSICVNSRNTIATLW
jgi:hypothetical protein